MYFLSEKLIQHAITFFRNLQVTTIDEQIEAGEEFFQLFGPGNIINSTDKPFERFSDYEALLGKIRDADHDKYQRIHKGTPFFFLAWTAFDLRNYEAGLFYLDCAISEDIRNTQNEPEKWLGLSAANFLTFKNLDSNPAKRVIDRCKNSWEKQIRRFNLISGLTPFDLNSFIEHFVCVLLKDNTKRTILTTLYTFILEFEDRYEALKLRGLLSGSLEPLLQHLFKGGLLFESLLKHLYPVEGEDKRVLSRIFQSPEFRLDFQISNLSTSASTLREIESVANDDSLKTAFKVISKIRNTTGHNLTWDDVFSDSKIYRKLFESEINAIFYLIHKKYPMLCSNNKVDSESTVLVKTNARTLALTTITMSHDMQSPSDQSKTKQNSEEDE